MKSPISPTKKDRMKILRTTAFPFNYRKFCCFTAFTLLELLTAVAILIVMTLVLAKMTGMAGAMWLGGQQRVNNLSKARAMLDLFARDAQAGIFRNDLAAFPTTTSTTSYAFYTKRPGIPESNASSRSVSLVKYEINLASPDSILLRGDMAIGWTSSATSISFGNTTSLPDDDGTNVIMRDTAPGVVGIKLVFIQADGSTSPSYLAASGTNAARAVGIALAVIDDTSMKTLAASDIANLQKDLSTVATGTRSPKADWEDYLNTNRSKYPKSLGEGLKIFERYVVLQ